VQRSTDNYINPLTAFWGEAPMARPGYEGTGKNGGDYRKRG